MNDLRVGNAFTQHAGDTLTKRFDPISYMHFSGLFEFIFSGLNTSNHGKGVYVALKRYTYSHPFHAFSPLAVARSLLFLAFSPQDTYAHTSPNFCMVVLALREIYLAGLTKAPLICRKEHFRPQRTPFRHLNRGAT